MAWTQADVTELQAAIKKLALGAKRVTYADRTVENHDLPQLRELLKDMESDVSSANGPRYTVATHHRDIG